MVVCEFCKRDVHAVTQAASWSPKMVCYDCLSNDGEEPQPLFPNRSHFSDCTRRKLVAFRVRDIPEDY